MKANELSNEQIRNLTPEQIDEIDALGPEADVDEYLAKPKKAETTDEQPEQEEQDAGFGSRARDCCRMQRISGHRKTAAE